MYVWLLLQIYPCNIRLVLWSRVTYKNNELTLKSGGIWPPKPKAGNILSLETDQKQEGLMSVH